MQDQSTTTLVPSEILVIITIIIPHIINAVALSAVIFSCSPALYLQLRYTDSSIDSYSRDGRLVAIAYETVKVRTDCNARCHDI